MGVCVAWGGSYDSSTGYGERIVAGEKWRAHRYAYLCAYGQDPGAAVVMHTCDNRACINPDHLRLGTIADNLADMRAKGRGKRGTMDPRAKLTDRKVAQMRFLYYVVGGYSQSELAVAYGVSQTVAGDAINGTTWKHVKQEDFHVG